MHRIQTTFFYLERFLKKLADDQCFSITKGSIYHIKHNVHTTFYHRSWNWTFNGSIYAWYLHILHVYFVRYNCSLFATFSNKGSSPTLYATDYNIIFLPVLYQYFKKTLLTNKMDIWTNCTLHLPHVNPTIQFMNVYKCWLRYSRHGTHITKRLAPAAKNTVFHVYMRCVYFLSVSMAIQLQRTINISAIEIEVGGTHLCQPCNVVRQNNISIDLTDKALWGEWLTREEG